MKKIKIGLYDPYLDTLGGGEKHILSILKVLAKEGYEINLFWDKNLTKEIENKFSPQFINELKFTSNIFLHHKPIINTLKTLRTLKTFDYFFYVTDGSYFFSTAKKNFVFCMVPQKKLYEMNIINRLKTFNYRFISNSQYTQKWLTKWGIKNDYIYPYIDEKLINNTITKKEKIILSVGRFFPHLHSKQHETMIKVFNKIKRSLKSFKDFKLVLAGGLKKEDENYFLDLKKLAKNNPSIIFKPNVRLDELYRLYRLSNFYWHFTGYGVDEKLNPEKVEHLGITPLEAMAGGCLTFCYNAGGPKEIITDGKNGYLFSFDNELISKMHSLINNPQKQQIIRIEASKFIRNNFSYEVFQKKVKEIIL